MSPPVVRLHERLRGSPGFRADLRAGHRMSLLHRQVLVAVADEGLEGHGFRRQARDSHRIGFLLRPSRIGLTFFPAWSAASAEAQGRP